MKDGFECSKCGSYNMKVMDSRPHAVGIRRRRRCLECGERLTTIEMTMDCYQNLLAEKAHLDQIKGTTTRLVEQIIGEILSK